MKGFAINNAPTDHGGIIPSTQLRSSQEDNTFVRAGDGHFCPKCKCWSTVVKSNDHVIFDGKAVAFVGDSLTCGAKILYQQSHVVGDAGGGSSGSSARSSSQPVNSQQNLTNSLVDDKEKKEEETCACNRDLTIAELKGIAPLAKKSEEYLQALNEQFKKYKMTSCLEKSHFLCQVLHESGSFKYLEEIGISDAEEASRYKGYKGRGLIQLTGPGNYENYGKYANENFLGENRKKIATIPKHAVGSAIWYWHYGKSIDLSTLVLKNDFIGITALINVGFNGWNDRKQYFDKAITQLKILKCKNTEPKILANISNFDFNTSYTYKNMTGESFGWGLWNDPERPTNKGKTKDVAQAKLGYQRFLEMAEGKEAPFGWKNKSKNEKSSRYGFSADKAVVWAKKRIGEIK